MFKSQKSWIIHWRATQRETSAISIALDTEVFLYLCKQVNIKISYKVKMTMNEYEILKHKFHIVSYLIKK